MDDNKQLYTIIMRHDTSTQWAVNNPILTLGEYAVEDDTHRVKRGDGETEWNDLPYEEFGLVYLVNYKNLSGEVSDNPQLQEALDTKMSLEVFEDVGYQAVSSINVEAESGAIGKITKISKNINTALSDTNVLLIKSTDNSIQGYWSVDDEGIRILNLVAESSITDYEVGHMYYRDQLCYYRNRLYRAVENFEAEAIFNSIHWVILASKHAEDIAYDNLASELDATDVQGALDELKRRNDTKVTKSTEQRVVYATDIQGKQTVIPIDDLRTVDSVNGIRATDQESKNIQIDASDINYDDDAQEPETIKEKLDQKVDKTVAGVGAKIVRDVQFNYNTSTGHITLTEDKVSLEDGSSATEEVEIDVVSEQELATEVQTLNDRIDDEVDTLNTTITTKETALYTRIQTEHDEINLRVTNEVNTLNATITALDTKVDNQVSRLDGRIDVAISDYTSRINNAVDALNNTIDSEVLTLNTRITTEVADLTTYIDEQDDLKIDKSIADSIVTLVDVASHDSQPTIRITNKNTQSKLPTYDYVHFTTAGQIAVSMADADHLVIDSTTIDTMNNQQNARLTNIEGSLQNYSENITTLFEHDTNHDRLITANSTQIVSLETRLTNAEEDIVDLDTKIEGEITNRTTADANLSIRIADNAVRIAQNTQGIRDNADSIDQLARTLEENVEALTNSKVNKDFAKDIGDKIVGKLESDVIANSELFNLKETMISPIDGTTSVERIKIISSDNTVIATRQSDGTIDLATNLDTDVNYFVTTEIISTTIAAETTLDITRLTPTDKQEVEVQDIISDPEGTWGRVKSVNTQNDTCVVVTFKKHAQAVWGTIKGTLSDQQDLQTALDSKIESVNGHATSAQSKAITLDGSDINVDETAQNKVTIKAQLEALNDDKVDKVSGHNKIYGTDNAGAQTTFDKSIFGVVDTVNNVSVDTNSKNISLDGSDINVDDTAQVPVTVQTAITNLISDLQNQIRTYAQDTSYTIRGTYTTQNYVTIENVEGVVLMAKVKVAFTSDDTEATTYESFVKDVENGNLVLIGIPEEVASTNEGQETMEILNQVDGVQDTYDGMGGTEQEIETVLDDISGNE